MGNPQNGPTNNTARLLPIHKPPDRRRDLGHLGLELSKFGVIVEQTLKTPVNHAWKPTEILRSDYLDYAETIVRTASHWQDETGAIIDPVDGREFAQTSPRFASAGAILRAFDRVEDISDAIGAAMDHSCRKLAEGEAEQPDFWMRELATAYMALSGIAPKQRMERWHEDLSSIDPERIYWRVTSKGFELESLHNWTVYAAAGEFLRAKLRLQPADDKFIWGEAFFEKYMPAQLSHFTNHGMYRDPHDPITYDMTTRLQIAVALAWGYSGPLEPDLNELLRRGGLTMLLTTSPGGFAPFGGRSGQLVFQEAIIAALSEFEALRYKKTDACLAGAFKRQAHVSAQSIRRWIRDRMPFQFVKNGFNPMDAFGLDGYAKYSCYGLLAASFLGLAALFSDDEIQEAPCPAEIGGFACELKGSFHKVFATCGGGHIEIDTKADLNYESTGLGRFQHRESPTEFPLSQPFTASPRYSVPEEYTPRHNVAIGPGWFTGGKLMRLADLSDGVDSRMTVEHASPDSVAFVLEYTHSPYGTAVREEYVLSGHRLELRSTVSRPEGQSPTPIRFFVPLIQTDGSERSRVIQEPGVVTVFYRCTRLEVRFDPSADAWIDSQPIANPNGLYTQLVLEVKRNGLNITMEIHPHTEIVQSP